jgi:hypothetical protein
VRKLKINANQPFIFTTVFSIRPSIDHNRLLTHISNIDGNNALALFFAARRHVLVNRRTLTISVYVIWRTDWRFLKANNYISELVDIAFSLVLTLVYCQSSNYKKYIPNFNFACRINN